MYGKEGTGSCGAWGNSSYILDGSTPRFHQESATVPTPNVLLYSSPTLENVWHTLLVQNLVGGGGRVFFCPIQVLSTDAQIIGQRDVRG